MVGHPLRPSSAAAFFLATVIASALPPPYGNPYVQCNPHELNLSITNVPGLFCSPKCNVIYENGCNPNKQSDVEAMPECLIGVNSTQNNYCALICNTDAPNDQCDTKGGASCHHVSGVQGVCTYESATTIPTTTTGTFHPHSEPRSEPRSTRWVNDPTLIHTINHPSTHATWVAEPSPRFEQWNLGRAATLCGAIRGDPAAPLLPTLNTSAAATVPTDFDGRVQWPHCNATIAHVRDQTDCGACWAFSATESFNDRRCVHTNDSILLSVQDTGACCSGSTCEYSNGCVNGHPEAAWQWFVTDGVVTGGDYSDVNHTDTCEPFSLPPCTHNKSRVAAGHPLCPPQEYKMPQCRSTCSNVGYANTYSNDKVKANSSFHIKPYPLTLVQSELMTYGSVSTVITVFEDFLTYKSGVYKHVQGWEVGSHAIIVLGWGIENGEKYWLCKNSWGPKYDIFLRLFLIVYSHAVYFWTTVCVHVLMIGCVRCLFISCCCIVLYSWGLDGFMKIGYGEIGLEQSFTAGYV
jgi:cathepsin B